MNVEATLQRAGFTQNEVKAYLSLLGLGKATSYQIVKEAKISSGKIYETLEKLIQRGLVSYIVINGKKHFQAADPDRLVQYMKKREEEASEETKAVAKILPTLKNNQKSLPKPKAEIFEGIGGIKTVYELMLKEGHSKILILGAPKEAGEKLDAYFDDFNQRRIKKKIALEIILNADHPREKKLKQLALTKVKVFPKNIITPAWIILFGDYVATVNITSPLVFLLKDAHARKSYEQYFELMWKIAR